MWIPKLSSARFGFRCAYAGISICPAISPDVKPQLDIPIIQLLPVFQNACSRNRRFTYSLQLTADALPITNILWQVHNEKRIPAWQTRRNTNFSTENSVSAIFRLRCSHRLLKSSPICRIHFSRFTVIRPSGMRQCCLPSVPHLTGRYPATFSEVTWEASGACGELSGILSWKPKYGLHPGKMRLLHLLRLREVLKVRWCSAVKRVEEDWFLKWHWGRLCVLCSSLFVRIRFSATRRARAGPVR
ncbi:hypothetical protein EJ06DRAFT_61115 [Trichodelitschia bisporula]|uniref:Uncharacterized protein n=1 Tax=Trichodelitschia bisporula TaxID=703511 RepID=A0A6G1HV02_9PEZI|nr:hypothetical protein EJ06DRAFT_61115 [Trichodelitschia bisporula]